MRDMMTNQPTKSNSLSPYGHHRISQDMTVALWGNFALEKYKGISGKDIASHAIGHRFNPYTAQTLLKTRFTPHNAAVSETPLRYGGVSISPCNLTGNTKVEAVLRKSRLGCGGFFFGGGGVPASGALRVRQMSLTRTMRGRESASDVYRVMLASVSPKWSLPHRSRVGNPARHQSFNPTYGDTMNVSQNQPQGESKPMTREQRLAAYKKRLAEAERDNDVSLAKSWRELIKDEEDRDAIWNPDW